MPATLYYTILYYTIYVECKANRTGHLSWLILQIQLIFGTGLQQMVTKMFPIRLCTVILGIFSLLPGLLEGARILAIFPYPGPSQYINVAPYLKALAARGHEVTSVNAFPQKKPVKNFRDIPVLEVFKSYEGTSK